MSKSQISKEIKKRISSFLVTTALAIIFLAVIAIAYDGKWICIDTIFQILLINILIHICLCIVDQIEILLLFVEIAVKLVTVLGWIMIGTVIFHWMNSLPVIQLLLIGCLVYIVACMIEAIHIRSDVEQINKMLKVKR